MISNRIKLAKAMFPGWTISSNIQGDLTMWPGKYCEGKEVRHVPDPFTSADDDYKVLQWLRAENNKPWPYRLSQLDYGTRRYKWDYQVGDYARAALEAISGEAVTVSPVLENHLISCIYRYGAIPDNGVISCKCPNRVKEG